MKTPANHPWKSKPEHRKVKAECAVCDKEFLRDPETNTKTCSVACYKQLARAKHVMHLTKGGFR